MKASNYIRKSKMEPDLKLSDKPDVTSREYTEYEEKKFLIPLGTSNVIRVCEK